MRSKTLLLAMAAAYLAGSAATSFADDGEMFRRAISSPPGETQDPEPEGEHAFVKMMNFRVPAQAANGELTPLTYTNIDGVDVLIDVPTAKPIVSVYVYGPVIGFDDFSQSGFPGHGRRDSFGAVSLDDGATWKLTNLSGTAENEYFALTDPVPNPSDPACHDGGLTFPLPEDAAAKADVAAVEGAPVITEAQWTPVNDAFGTLEVEGTAEPRARVDIVDQDGNLLFRTRADSEGAFAISRSVRVDDAPCEVAAVVDGVSSDPVPVEGTPADCVPPVVECEQLDAYPGDVTNVFHAVAGNKVLVAWQSKACSAGFPGYTGGAISDADALAGYLGIDNAVDLYLQDLFVVGGSQLSTDYKEQEEFEGEYDGVGEVPYNCLWTARGVLREDPEALGTTEVVWFQAERLTSGRRDVNRVETSCTAGGGCAISWQEDPEGLRPGEGEGAGTGWAGATTNSQTDIWYSFIEWEDFDIVNVDGTPTPLANEILATGRPQPYVPMMVPARLSNNARCTYPVNPTDITYCNEEVAGLYGIKNQCVGSVEIPLGQQGDLQPICVVDANDDDTMNYGDLPNVANTASSRPRLNLQPRDSDGDGVTDDAWVVIIHEEDKGLGRFGFQNDVAWDGNLDNTGVFCGDPDASLDDNCIEADIGKNQWYISFALGTPQTSAALEEDFGLVNNLVAQHNQYNAPEVNWITGTFYPPNSTEDMWDFGDLNFLLFNNEIARRASLMTQPLSKALLTAEDEALMAMPLFKEGTINQGGPADIMARRVAIKIDGGGGGCDGPGVSPTIDEAVLTCKVEDDGSLSDCQIEITGEVCVEGNQAGTEIILDGYSGGDANVELCEDFVSIDVDEGTTFTGTCALEDDQVEELGLPCTVKVVVGPGSTTGQGQQSDPVEVEDGTEGDLLLECYDGEEG